MTVRALPLPSDFSAFWAEVVAEGEALPLDLTLGEVSAEKSTADHSVRVFSFRGSDGETRHGWLASPLGEAKGYGFLWLPPYSRWSMLPNPYGTRPGATSLSLNFFGESAFHQESYHPARGYFAEGVGSEKTWIFRRMFLDAFLMARYLAPQVSGRLASMGMSQGGGLSIWLGAHCPLIRAVAADMPFLAGMDWVLGQRLSRYPLKELADFMEEDPAKTAALRQTVGYFDTLSQATLCRVPTLLSLGLKDPAVRPDQVRALQAALPGENRLVELDWGHDWHPSMVQTNQEWIESRLLAP